MGAISNRVLQQGQFEVLQADYAYPAWTLKIRNISGEARTFKVGTGPSSTVFSDSEPTALSGVAAVSLSSLTVSGATGTAFDTELSAGSVISLEDGLVLGTVSSIASATSLTLTSAWAGASDSGVTLYDASMRARTIGPGQTESVFVLPKDVSGDLIGNRSFIYIQAVDGAIEYSIDTGRSDVSSVRDSVTEV